MAHERALFNGSGAAVTCVDLSPEELLAGFQDGWVRRYALDGTELAAGHCGAPVRAAAFWGDALFVETGREILVRARDAAARFALPRCRYERAGERLLAFPDEERAVLVRSDGTEVTELDDAGAGLSPDGGRVYTRGRLLDAEGEEVRTLEPSPPPPRHAFGPGRLATFGADARIRLWDLEGRPGAVLEDKAEVHLACFSRAADRLLTATRLPSLAVWDLATGRPALLWQEGPVAELGFTPAGDYAWAVGEDGMVRVFDRRGQRVLEGPVTDELLRALRRRTWSRGREGGGEVIAEGPLGEPLVAGRDGRAEASGKPLLGHRDAVTHGCFSADGSHVATASRDGTARLWRLRLPDVIEAGGALWSCGMPWAKDTVYALAGNTLGIWRTDGTEVGRHLFPTGIRWWAYARGADRVAIVPRGADRALVYHVDGDHLATLGHPAEVSGVWMTRAGTWILTWAEDRCVRLWDGAGGLEREVAHPHPVSFAMPSPDGEHFFSITVEGRARIIRRDGTLRAEWIPPETIREVRFSDAGDRLLAVSATDGAVRLFDLDGGQLAEMFGHAAPATHARFSGAGDMFLTCGPDGRAILWGARGDLLRVLVHPEAVTYATFLPGDRRIVTTCADGVARIFTRRGVLAAEIHAHRASAALATYDRTGQLIATCGQDGTVRLWPVEPEALLALADRRASRGFTGGERERYAALLGAER